MNFKLNESQLKSLADIGRDIAQVVLAGLVIDQIVSDRFDWVFITIGTLLSLILWYANIYIVGRLKQ
jgi:hypothetical protein